MNKTKEENINIYLMNSPKVVAEMLYDTIKKYEKYINDVVILKNLQTKKHIGYSKSKGTRVILSSIESRTITKLFNVECKEFKNKGELDNYIKGFEKEVVNE